VAGFGKRQTAGSFCGQLLLWFLSQTSDSNPNSKSVGWFNMVPLSGGTWVWRNSSCRVPQPLFWNGLSSRICRRKRSCFVARKSSPETEGKKKADRLPL